MATTRRAGRRRVDIKVTLYSRNGQVISRNYIEVARALEGVKGDAVIDGELVALDENGVSHFQLGANGHHGPRMAGPRRRRGLPIHKLAIVACSRAGE